VIGHADARAVIRAALRAPQVAALLQGQAADPVLEQAFQAQGWLESGYGSGRARNNWGSVQAGHGPPCQPGSVELTDHHKDGSPYQWCYRAYDTPTVGAADMMRQVLRRPWMEALMRSGDATAIEGGLRHVHRAPFLGAYLEGPHNYALGLEKRAAVIAETIGEPVYVVRGGGQRPKSAESGASYGAALAVAALVALVVVTR